MATGPNYSNISVNDSGFFIVDSSDGTLSTGVSFGVSGTGLRKATFQDKSGTIAFLDDITENEGASSVKADDITPGDASVLITTSSGGVSLDTNSGNNLVLNHGGVPQVTLGLSTMTLQASDLYTITHTGSTVNDNLTIEETGTTANLVLQASNSTANDAIFLNAPSGGISMQTGTGGFTLDSTGTFNIDSSVTGSNAIKLNASGAGNIDIVANSGASPIILQEHTKYYGFSYTHATNNTFEQLIKLNDLQQSGVSSAHFINAAFTAVKGTCAASYVMDEVFMYDQNTFVNQGSSQAVGYGKFDAFGLPGSNTQMQPDSSGITIRYKSNLGSGTNVKGLVKVISSSL